MARSSEAARVVVFKFKESSIVDLCEEVAEYVRSGQAERDGVDVSAAHTVSGNISPSLLGCNAVVFPRKESKP